MAGSIVSTCPPRTRVILVAMIDACRVVGTGHCEPTPPRGVVTRQAKQRGVLRSSAKKVVIGDAAV
jgi:hypothetical protein